MFFACCRKHRYYNEIEPQENTDLLLDCGLVPHYCAASSVGVGGKPFGLDAVSMEL